MDIKTSMENITGTLMKKRIGTVCAAAFAFALVLMLSGCALRTDDATEAVPQQEELEISIDEASDNVEANIEIPQDDDTDRMVSVSVENLGRTDPFMPFGETEVKPVLVVPQEKLKYDLLEPLETPSADSTAQKVVTTKVSGIMYDKNNPSAILNIDGTDYLVRSGDVLNGYKVLSISKSVVIVQMGKNVYKAGVGELVASGSAGVNYNTVANLSDKFGGSKE